MRYDTLKARVKILFASGKTSTKVRRGLVLPYRLRSMSSILRLFQRAARSEDLIDDILFRQEEYGDSPYQSDYASPDNARIWGSRIIQVHGA